MTFPVYLWHPVFVHFSVALLTMATVFYFLATLLPRARLRKQWITVAEWNLWIGFALAVPTLLFGWLAFNTVEHDDASHAAMQTHATLAFATGGGFALLVLWSVWHRQSKAYPSRLFTGLLVVCFGFLAATGWRGGELVYRYGLAVNALQKPEAGSAPPSAEQPSTTKDKTSGHDHHDDHQHDH
jgi:uncharacterized membrane protein